eukprot:gnl/TRDRNA2_/TRDRNA2_73919_c0_seq2.p1 gnl/TRDRNA2_/TRDRNA2_73919_c0~~gnl/TRDRNA2_/TRDRNA2_73919_c0_seq2.p1  ORF type:complete len:117 (+),score=24.07 gnl/TRDRNA2_/TRDRNA2_73919_c0_seq2:17-367(+)
MEKQQLHRYVQTVIGVAAQANKYISIQEPWRMKDNMPRMRTVLYTLAETIRRLAIMLEPVIPSSCTKILDQLGTVDELRTFASVADGSRLPPGTPVLKASPIFPRIEEPKPAELML